ncbi:hypothetical protein BJ508DRAFT_331859 [Ascobolus immersus RN42]|uniref:SMAD/FHA domain-containing protein n=1 Tax=Ascobolus immersus RN42 TaxID=1160509 RepID=A0A3N4HQS0_ASCIM|nr:hypothetical protein BJ508DRAFT_331859 [Ascobolus immersus RN42]
MPTTASQTAHAIQAATDFSTLREVQLQLDSISSLTTMNPATNTGAETKRPEARVPIASIRFIPHTDPRVTRESLHFSPIERLLHAPGEIVRVGRYSDRDATKPDCPVGFKSKVVSRRHCEFWCDGGQWYIKDVKSSSGTFLNHIRLSPPGQESKAYPVNNGDIIQLGIDFKGGEEQIFRCVKMRVELNRCLNKGRNHFNVAAHKNLKKLASSNKREDDTSSVHTSECSICLMGVAPCQSLFVAPCSHVWHYRCIRPLVEKEWPIFLCPNCRAVADLDREIEEDDEMDEAWEAVPESILNGAEDAAGTPNGAAASPQPTPLAEPASVATATNVPAQLSPPVALTPPVAPTTATSNTSVAATNGSSNGSSHRTTNGTPSSGTPNGHQRGFSEIDPLTDRADSPSETGSGSDGPSRYAFQLDDVDNDSADPAALREGTSLGSHSGSASPGFPMTPRNNVGPFVFHTPSRAVQSNLGGRGS